MKLDRCCTPQQLKSKIKEEHTASHNRKYGYWDVPKMQANSVKGYVAKYLAI